MINTIFKVLSVIIALDIVLLVNLFMVYFWKEWRKTRGRSGQSSLP